MRNLREAVEILTDQLDDQKRHLDHALTNRAIVRYDAFRDAGGEQSASFALLDQYRSGVVFSAIAARDFARIYVKHISEGVADRDLSPEEVQVMELAVPKPLPPGERGSQGQTGPPAGGAGRPAGLPPLHAADEAGGAAGRSGRRRAREPDDAPVRGGHRRVRGARRRRRPGARGQTRRAKLGDDFTWEPPPRAPAGRLPFAALTRPRRLAGPPSTTPRPRVVMPLPTRGSPPRGLIA